MYFYNQNKNIFDRESLQNLAVIFWSYKTHLIVKIIFRASAAALIFLDKVTSRWKPQYNIFYLHIFLLFLIFFYKKYKKDFEFGRLGDSYTEETSLNKSRPVWTISNKFRHVWTSLDWSGMDWSGWICIGRVVGRGSCWV